MTNAVTGILCQSIKGALHPAYPLTEGSHLVVAENSHSNPAGGGKDIIGLRRARLFDGEVCHSDSFCTTQHIPLDGEVKT